MQKSVRKAALKTKVGAGRSGFYAEVWKRLFISTQFGDSTTDSCYTFSEVIKKLCLTEYLSLSLQAFPEFCLIQLNKNPGPRPMCWCKVFVKCS